MTMIRFAKIKETLFGMFYVMTDGRAKPSPNAMRNLIILFVIDFCQVLRVMLSPMYGWNERTYDVAKHVDMVYNTTKLLSFLVPRYTFFALAFLLVGFAIGNAVYCARLFKAGEIKKIGPVKALRFMVAVVVTTLFSSTMKWLLIPLECLASDEKSLSSYIHGEGAPCSPWAFPDIMLTAPTLVLIPFYVGFALTASLFSLGTNPLSCAPHVQFTGRVEVLFILGKVLSTFLVFLSDTITPVATTAILFFLFAGILYRHLVVLPFHHRPTNVLRGGIYTAICWLATTSLIVSTVKHNKLLSEDTFQTMQWLMVGFIPVSFTIGCWFTYYRFQQLLLCLDRLRGEYEHHAEDITPEGTAIDGVHGSASPLKQHSLPIGRRGSVVGVPRSSARARTNYDNFFDPSWERKRAFASGQQAHTIARILLMQRQEWDLPFLSYVIFRSLEEHPDSQTLQVFRLSMLRFVFRNTTEAASEEKKMKSTNVALAVDHEYVLYAVERKASQDYAATNMGQGQFNAINLMEFDSGMQTARAAHLLCVMEMRKFWNNVSSQHKKKDFAVQIADSVHRLVEFNKALEKAQQEYDQLLEKYPQSVQLLLSYASFCDAVLNDIKVAEEMRRQASVLEGGDAEENELNHKQQELENQAQASAATSEQETFRLKVLRQYNEWSKQIFGVERNALGLLDRRLRVFFFLLLVASTLAFLVMQLWLFKDMAKKDVHLINKTGDQEGMADVQATIKKLSGNLQAQHWDNYEIIRSKSVEDYYLRSPVQQLLPAVDGWHIDELSFWHFGNDWSRRMERSSINTVQDLQEDDWSLTSLGEGRMNMQYMTENGFRTAIPILEEIVTIYEQEMQALWTLTKKLVAICTAVNGSILIIICVLMTRGVKFTIQRMQHMHLACVMAVQLPAVTTKKLHHFYRDAEVAIRAIEDEDNEQGWLLAGDQDHGGTDRDAEELKDGVGSTVSAEQSMITYELMGTNVDGFRVSREPSGVSIESGYPERQVKPLSIDNVERFKAENSPLRDKARNFTLANCTSLASTPNTEAPSQLERSGVLAMLKKLEHTGPEEAVGGDRKEALSRLAKMIDEAFGGEWQTEADHIAKHALALNPDTDLEKCTAVVARNGKGGEEAAEEGGDVLPAQVEGDASAESSAQLDVGGRAEGCVDLGSTLDVTAGIVLVQRPERGSEERVGDTEDDGAGVSSDGSWRNSKGSDRVAARWSTIVRQSLVHDRTSTRHGIKQAEETVGENDGSELAQERSALQIPEPKGQRLRHHDSQDSCDPDLLDASEPDVSVRRLQHTGSERLHSARMARKLPGQNGAALPRPSPHAQQKEGAGLEMERSGEAEQHWSRGGRGQLGPHAAKPCLKVSQAALKDGGGVRFESCKGKRNSFSESFQSMASKSSERVRRFFAGGRSSPTRTRSQQLKRANAKSDDDEDQGHMPLNDVNPEQERHIRFCVSKRWPLAVRTSVHVLALVAVMAISVLNTTYPARRMDALVTLAPTINQAGRRRFLTRSCVHLARELVLDDGFSRMRKAEIASALNYYLNELKVANDAVRLGGALRITVGADFRNRHHNEIMYGKGCPWRDDPTDCSTPERPDAAANGLYHLSLSFMDAVQSVLKRYGPPASEYTDDFLRSPRLNESFADFEHVAVDPERVKLLTEDQELVFILNGFKGDMFTGFAYIVEVFDQELRDIINDAMSDNQNIFVVYMIVTFGGAYFLFRRAVAEACHEGDKARSFVARIPSHALSQLEIDTVAHIFSAENAQLHRSASG